MKTEQNNNFTEVVANLFDLKAESYVNTVNCVGVMGKGIALEFKIRYPHMYLDYVRQCREGLFTPGQVRTWHSGTDNIWIYNMATKKHWKNPSKFEWVKEGLVDLACNLEFLAIKSIVMPRPGCGNGGLDWEQVRPLVVAFSNRVSFCKVTVATL